MASRTHGQGGLGGRTPERDDDGGRRRSPVLAHIPVMVRRCGGWQCSESVLARMCESEGHAITKKGGRDSVSMLAH
jgi:hypothetical protein